MILIISICKEPLHELEFVKPVEEIVKKDFTTKHYNQLTKKDLKEAKKVIICGTSLKDFEYLNNLDNFFWIKDFEKPILGICAGMQIIGLVFDGKLKKKKEIGFYKENFIKDFFGLKGKQEVYHLHNNYVTLPSGFKKFTDSKIPQTVKHKTKPIYGVLFHPEVRNKEMIKNFLKF